MQNVFEHKGLSPLVEKTRESPDLSASIIGSVMDAIIAVDDTQRVVVFNAAAERMFACPASEAIGSSVERFIPERFRTGLSTRVRHFAESGLTSRTLGGLGTLWGLRATGEEFPIEASISKVESGGQKYFTVVIRDITERKMAEEALRAREERLRLAQSAAHVGTYDLNLRTGVNIWQPETEALFGLPPGSFGGTLTAFEDLIHPDDRERIRELTQEMIRTRQDPDEDTEYRVVWPDGSVHWIAGRGRLVLDESGEPSRMIGVNVDITGRKLAEQELAITTERLHLAIEAGSVGGWDFDLRTGRTVWFGKSHAQLGMTPDETVGSSEEFWQRVHEDDRADLRNALRLARVRHEEFNHEFRVVRRDGTTHWLRSRGRYQYAVNDEPERLLGLSIDITESKEAEQALLRHCAIVESSDDGISSVTLDGIIVTWNAGAERMFGYSENEVVGKPASIIVPPELRDQQKKVLEMLRAGGRIEQFETVRVSKTGKRIDVSLSISPIKDPTGKIVGCAGIARDITQRKRAEEVLQSSERRYRLLFERNVAGVGIASLDGRVLDCTDSWARILGYESKDEVLGHHASEFYFNPAERQSLVDQLRDKQQVFSRELQLKRKDGSPIWVLFSAAVHSDHDRPTVQTTMIDISEWKRAEEALSGMTRKLIEAQEQERTRIARDLHDDIAQRLALLTIDLEEIEDTAMDAGLRKGLGEIRKQVSDVATNVQTLSHELYSSKLEYLGLLAAVKGFCNEFRAHQRAEIELGSHDLPTDLPKEISICLFRVLQQALHNAAKHSGVKRFEVQLWGTPTEIHLSVSDFGIGFDVEEALKKQGIGLMSMKERMRLVGGELSIDSQPKRGTTIHARVPFRSSGELARAAG